MPTRGERACSLSPECSLSYAKIMQGECNGKVVRQSLTKLDTAEPQLILCKDNARWVQRQGGETKSYQA